MRFTSTLRWAGALSGLSLGLSPLAAAHAADEEIQVYMDEIGALHALGLDVHLNYVPDGRTLPDYPGQQASERRWRITPEWSYALNSQFELGAYLPLATIDRSGRVDAGGAKVRLKWVAPKAEGQDWFWGLNMEVGRVKRSLDINPWNTEVKGIVGVRKGPWTLAANLNVDWALSGPQQGPPTVQLATKAAYKLSEATSIGLESYNDLGDTKHIGSFNRLNQQTYLVLDQTLGRWDLNLGIGRGYGSPEDNWTIKAVVSVPID